MPVAHGVGDACPGVLGSIPIRGHSTGDLLPSEYAGGFLFALQRLDGGLRPILCGDLWRRCLASLAAQACRKPLARQYLTSFDNFIQCAGIKDGPSHAAHTLGADALDQRCAILVHGRTARHNHSYSQSTRCYVTTRSRAKCQACGVCNCNLQTHDEHAHSLL